MTEEDIIDIAERIANFGWSDYDNLEENKKAIQGLLDLYNKEKEKNKELMLDKKAFTDNYGNMILKIAELKKENKEIRQWKYVIDTYEDLDKLKKLDLIKIKGKKYIAENRLQEFKDLLLKELDRDFVTEEYRQAISCYFKKLLEEQENEKIIK